MVRLDKFLCDCNIGTRSQVKEAIRKGAVTVNGEIIKKSDQKIKEEADIVKYQGSIVTFRQFSYYMLNKPAGVVSATNDNTADTVLSLLTGVSDKDLFPVGRLDKDTTGLLLITNDGQLAHKLLSPRKHVDKQYLAVIRSPLTVSDSDKLTSGVDIGDEKPTLPARVNVLSDSEIILTIQEGRFHQVKRMLQAVGNEVLTLKRISFGPLQLDPQLAEGAFRELTEEEYDALLRQTE